MDTVLQVEDIIKNVKEWAENIQIQYSEILTLEVLTERNVIYRAEFTCSHCMAEVLVGKPYWAPYRNVSFIVIALVNNVAEIVYHWYDSYENTISDILEQLNKGIRFATDYNF